MSYLSNEAPGRRAARLSRVSVVLWLVTLVLLIVAAGIGFSGEATGSTAYLPVPVGLRLPALFIIIAAFAACGAVLFGLAAAHTMAAMRVLDRDRRIPPAISSEVRQKASRILGPAAVARYQLDQDITPPPSALPSPAPIPVRLTVLMPAPPITRNSSSISR